MDKKQKEAHVLALYEKGKTYREITKEAGVSPNTIKAIVNKAGLDQMTSISSRAFELYVKQKTPLEVAIALNLEAEKAIQYHQQYFILLGCTEFTRVYPQIKDNPWLYVNLARLIQNARMGDGEVVELLKIANGYLPRVKLEYDRFKEEKSSLQAELNSWRAELNNIARTYQQFVDRNIELKRREDELQHGINKLEAKESELQKTISRLEQHISVLENNVNTTNLNPEVNQGDVIPMNDELIPSLICHKNENEIPYYSPQVEPSSRTLIFDTKDLF
jgi:predicted transcriptional regulator